MQACMRSTGRRPGVSRRQLRAALSLAQSSGRVFDHEFGLFSANLFRWGLWAPWRIWSRGSGRWRSHRTAVSSDHWNQSLLGGTKRWQIRTDSSHLEHLRLKVRRFGRREQHCRNLKTITKICIGCLSAPTCLVRLRVFHKSPCLSWTTRKLWSSWPLRNSRLNPPCRKQDIWSFSFDRGRFFGIRSSMRCSGLSPRIQCANFNRIQYFFQVCMPLFLRLLNLFIFTSGT